MGITLTHEHIMSNFGLEIDKTGYYDEEAALKQTIPYLKKLKLLGVQTIFDCTTAFFGRRTDLLKKIADSTGIKIVTNTGYYGAANDRYIPKQAYKQSAEEISKQWVDEFQNGIDDRGIKPGFIKLAFDDGNPSEIDTKLFEAGVLTHKKTGLTLAVHTGDNPEALTKELQLLEKHNVDPSAFVWVHANKRADSQLMLELALKGVWISLDGVNESNTKQYIDWLTQFKANNLLHKVLLSHDGNSFPKGGAIRPYDAIPLVLVPALKNEGFSIEEINQLLIINPKEAFAIEIRIKK